MRSFVANFLQVADRPKTGKLLPAASEAFALGRR